MCLSTVYEESAAGRTKVSEYVSSVQAEDGKVTLVDVMGVEKVITGIIKKLDLVNNIIIVENK